MFATVLTAASLSLACGSGERTRATATSDGASVTPAIDNTALNNKLALNGQPTLAPGANAYPTIDPTFEAISNATLVAIATETIERQQLTCGPDADRDGPIAKDYGAWFGRCQLFGNFWVVRTSEIVAEYECVPSDDACLAGGEPAVPGAWRTAPVPAYRIVTFDPPDKLRRFNDGACLSLVTLTLLTGNECAPIAPTAGG
ncbi:MAG: hypothetical protein ACHQO8_07680 [Vicinamibacterales bacterium]